MANRRKVTSKDVAAAAGVSQAAVSMILNKRHNASFSREVVMRVEKAAKDLGYTLPKHRKRIKKKREKMIVVLCPNMTNPYYVMLLQGIECRAAEQGIGIFVCNTQRSLELEERYLKMIPGINPEGVIYACNPSRCFWPLVKELSERVPVTVINNQNERLDVDGVELDNEKLGALMAKHLLELGHRKVAYITPPLTLRQKQRSKRVEGFIAEFKARGLENHVMIRAADAKLDQDVPGIDSEYRIGYDLTMEILGEGDIPTAIAGLNDMIAFGIMDALYDRKIKVPSEISVMGCDNTLFGRLNKISLTTVEHFVIYKGMDACDIILKKIDAQRTAPDELTPVSIYHVEYEPRVVLRGSTSYPPGRRKNQPAKNN